ncbi:hypothetical protein F2P81_009401 [Scophthalmus maximus]|uniref:Uncharacterized protein n=1 Tax=Scophthalmus maximus TaxID=52904 RepID=A0A6A4SZ18_SCOMX|nr:hypothetical protein F2P81_009401 [Scophthalmus maximus]
MNHRREEEEEEEEEKQPKNARAVDKAPRTFHSFIHFIPRGSARVRPLADAVPKMRIAGKTESSSHEPPVEEGDGDEYDGGRCSCRTPASEPQGRNCACASWSLCFPSARLCVGPGTAVFVALAPLALACLPAASSPPPPPSVKKFINILVDL